MAQKPQASKHPYPNLHPSTQGSLVYQQKLLEWLPNWGRHSILEQGPEPPLFLLNLLSPGPGVHAPITCQTLFKGDKQNVCSWHSPATREGKHMKSYGEAGRDLLLEDTGYKSAFPIYGNRGKEQIWSLL